MKRTSPQPFVERSPAESLGGLIVVTGAELNRLIREAVRAELEKGARMTVAAEPIREWFNTKEAAVYCMTSKDAILKYVSRGDLVPDSPSRPGFRVHRFRRATLDAFLEGKP